jgi:hypothetical protein
MDRLDRIIETLGILHNEMRRLREDAYNREHDPIPSVAWDQAETDGMASNTTEAPAQEPPEVRDAYQNIAKIRETAHAHYKELLNAAEHMEHRAEQLHRAAGIWEQLASQ